MIWDMLNPQTLINKVQSIKKLTFQLFQETTFFFTGFPAARTNIPPKFNIAQTCFTVCVVTVIIHPGPDFRHREGVVLRKTPLAVYSNSSGRPSKIKRNKSLSEKFNKVQFKIAIFSTRDTLSSRRFKSSGR